VKTEPGLEFWGLLDQTRPPEEDPAAHADALVEVLVSRGADATLEFADDLDAALTALYTWDLRWTANLAIFECSDEMFLHLRAWLIGRGYTTWAVARYEAEATFLNLLRETGNRVALGERLAGGKHLLGVASRAHEALTGRRLEHPGPEADLPPGEPIDPDRAPIEFPDLYRAASTAWSEEREAMLQLLDLIETVNDGLDAAAFGKHEKGVAILRPLFDDPESWDKISADPDMRTGVAYALGIADMMAGRVDRAAETFQRVEADFAEVPELRRGMAQAELARGELDSAAALLDPAPDAARFDRILTAKLAWRQGDRDEAVRRALEELDRDMAPEDHPWDVAGALLQAGHVLVDAGMASEARRAAREMKPLLRGTEDDFNLKQEWRLLEAAVARISGKPAKALELTERVKGADGYTVATRHRERARALRDLGRTGEAAVAYQEAIAVLEDAGERWEARALADELAALGA
jgi:tetratricopeptide (TPR) repeat protein